MSAGMDARNVEEILQRAQRTPPTVRAGVWDLQEVLYG
jgi:hypothetical protein